MSRANICNSLEMLVLHFAHALVGVRLDKTKKRVAPAPTVIKLTANEAVITQLIIIYAALKRRSDMQIAMAAADFPRIAKIRTVTSTNDGYLRAKQEDAHNEAGSQCIVNPQRPADSSGIHFLCAPRNDPGRGRNK